MCQSPTWKRIPRKVVELVTIMEEVVGKKRVLCNTENHFELPNKKHVVSHNSK